MSRTVEKPIPFAALAGVCVLSSLAAACGGPEPRSYNDFMADPVLRAGTIARCNQDRDASLHDVECANARRAAATVAVMEERERREQLERESQRKLEELRALMALQQERERQAAEAARAAAEAAYEQLWVDPDAPQQDPAAEGGPLNLALSDGAPATVTQPPLDPAPAGAVPAPAPAEIAGPTPIPPADVDPPAPAEPRQEAFAIPRPFRDAPRAEDSAAPQ
ncbi:MAG TPA: EexN family lipoprotein [Gammaproteobacteria bacterium]